MKIFHVSDIHVGKNTNHDHYLKAFLDLVRSRVKQKNLLIVTGDITDDGRKKQYEKAYKLFDSLEGNVLFVPGNHDYATEGVFFSRRKYERWQAFSGHYVSRFLLKFRHQNWKQLGKRVVYNDEIAIVLLDSVPPHGGVPWAYARGVVPASQIALLGDVERKFPNHKLLCALHHHPFDKDWFLELANAQALINATYGLYDTVLFGHRHHGPRLWHLAMTSRNKRAIRTKYIFSPSPDDGSFDLYKIHVSL